MMKTTKTNQNQHPSSKLEPHESIEENVRSPPVFFLI